MLKKNNKEKNDTMTIGSVAQLATWRADVQAILLDRIPVSHPCHQSCIPTVPESPASRHARPRAAHPRLRSTAMMPPTGPPGVRASRVILLDRIPADCTAKLNPCPPELQANGHLGHRAATCAPAGPQAGPRGRPCYLCSIGFLPAILAAPPELQACGHAGHEKPA